MKVHDKKFYSFPTLHVHYTLLFFVKFLVLYCSVLYLTIFYCGFSSDWGDVGAATLCPGGHELTVRQVQIPGRGPSKNVSYIDF
jgi:hypothetical protein